MYAKERPVSMDFRMSMIFFKEKFGYAIFTRKVGGGGCQLILTIISVLNFDIC